MNASFFHLKVAPINVAHLLVHLSHVTSMLHLYLYQRSLALPLELFVERAAIRSCHSR